jgi:hypothetical protein
VTNKSLLYTGKQSSPVFYDPYITGFISYVDDVLPTDTVEIALGYGSHVTPTRRILLQCGIDPAAIFTVADDVVLVDNPDPDKQRPNQCHHQERFSGTEPTKLVTNPNPMFSIPVGRYLADCLAPTFSQEFVNHMANYEWLINLEDFRAQVIRSFFLEL